MRFQNGCKSKNQKTRGRAGGISKTTLDVSQGEGDTVLRELARIERIRGRYEALGVPQLRWVTVDALKTHTLLVAGSVTDERYAV